MLYAFVRLNKIEEELRTLIKSIVTYIDPEFEIINILFQKPDPKIITDKTFGICFGESTALTLKTYTKASNILILPELHLLLPLEANKENRLKATESLKKLKNFFNVKTQALNIKTDLSISELMQLRDKAIENSLKEVSILDSNGERITISFESNKEYVLFEDLLLAKYIETAFNLKDQTLEIRKR